MLPTSKIFILTWKKSICVKLINGSVYNLVLVKLAFEEDAFFAANFYFILHISLS